jgi:hypothetical protein
MVSYTLYAIGIAALFYTILPLLKSAGAEQPTKSLAGRLGRHTAEMMAALHPSLDDEAAKKKANNFLLSTGAVSALGFVLPLLVGAGAALSVGIALFFAVASYMLLRSRLTASQITGSYEGQTILVEVLDEYKMHHFNMRYAIENSIKRLDAAPIGKEHLFRLSVSLRTAKSNDEIKEALDVFAFSVGTEWSKMLASNIYHAVADGTIVTAGLEDLLLECEYTKKTLEKQKRLNNEAGSMVKFLAPITYLALIGSMPYYFEISIFEVLSLQFLTPTGLILMIVIIALCVAGIIVINLTNRPKFDV